MAEWIAASIADSPMRAESNTIRLPTRWRRRAGPGRLQIRRWSHTPRNPTLWLSRAPYFPSGSSPGVHLYRLIPCVAGTLQESDMPSRPRPLEIISGSATDQGRRGYTNGPQSATGPNYWALLPGLFPGVRAGIVCSCPARGGFAFVPVPLALFPFWPGPCPWPPN